MTNPPNWQNQQQSQVPPQGAQPGSHYGQRPGPYPPHPGSYPGQQQYSQWYNPNAGPLPTRPFNKSDLVHKPVYLLLLISAGLYLARDVVGLLELLIRSQQFSGADTGAMLGTSIMSSVIGVGIVGALYLLTLIPMTMGQNWGRVVGFVMASLGTLGSLFSLVVLARFMTPLGLPQMGLTLLFVGVNIAWIVVAAKTWERPIQAPSAYPPFH